MAVRLRELHDGAVRLARHQERLLPLGVGDVDVHGLEARAADALDRGREAGHLEREMVRARAVTRDEPREEVVLLDGPRFEELDRHPVAVGCADEHLHRAEPDRLPAEDHGPAERAREEAQRFGGVGRGERDVVEVVAGAHGGGRLAADREESSPRARRLR